MIRKATIEDAEAIARIHVQAWREAYRGIIPAEYLAGLSEEMKAAFWRQQLASGRSVTLVALDGEKVVGWASGGPSQSAESTAVREIFAIYISPSVWRRGVGRKLMQEIETALLGTGPIILWVLRANQSAFQFYEKLGYHHDGGEKAADFGGVRLQALRLRRHIGAAKHCRITTRCARGVLSAQDSVSVPIRFVCARPSWVEEYHRLG